MYEIGPADIVRRCRVKGKEEWKFIDVDKKKEGLLGKVEAQLKQKMSVTPLFTVRFKII